MKPREVQFEVTAHNPLEPDKPHPVDLRGKELFFNLRNEAGVVRTLSCETTDAVDGKARCRLPEDLPPGAYVYDAWVHDEEDRWWQVAGPSAIQVYEEDP
jgi:hypothetical protein